MDTSNNVVDKTVQLFGGVSRSIHYDTNGNANPTWQYPNIHGDILFQADQSGNKTTSNFLYDPYGQPLAGHPDDLTGNFDYGWLGSKQRGTELEGSLNIIEMGARQYSPLLGRFLEVDPIEGGSANDYDYVDGDPINGRDFDGTRSLFSAIAGIVNQVAHAVAKPVRSVAKKAARSVGAAVKAVKKKPRFQLFAKENKNLVTRAGKPGIHWSDVEGLNHQNRLEWSKTYGWHFNDAEAPKSHRSPWVGLGKAIARGAYNVGRGAAGVFDGVPTPIMNRNVFCPNNACGDVPLA
jgi:RHS repeat-associated protein